MMDTIKRIFEILGTRKTELYKSIIYKLIHSIFAAFSLFAILYIMANIDMLSLSIITNATLLLFAGFIGQFICKWRSSIKISVAAYDTFEEKRLHVGEELKQAPMGYYNSQNLGSIQTAVTTGMNELESNAVAIVENMIGNIIYSLVSTAVLFFFNVYVGLVTFVMFILSNFVLFWIQKASDQFATQQVISKEKMTSKVMDFVRGIMVVRLFTHKGEELTQVNDAFKLKKNADLLVESSVTWPVNVYAFIFKLSGCAVICVAAIQCLNGTMPFAYCMMLLLSAFLVNTQMASMGGNIAVLKVVRAALLHFDSVLDMPKMKGDKTISEENSLDISVSNVDFAYTDTMVIKNVSMNFPYGSTNAIIGASGSGKTTICNLIARFFDVNKGCIKMGGIDVKDLKPEEIVKKISFVFQDVYLFEDTVENNVKFGNEHATHEEVIDACKKARCHEFITSMSLGYNTKIGEGGATLSGGEKQRISIARAMMKDAKIIILDEATSSVDPENEHLLIEALEELSKNKTLITIAHRLSTISKADCIYVMDKGSIVQQGRHNDLIKEDGIYKKFIQIRQESVNWGLKSS